MSAVEGGLRADIVWEANTGQAIADLGAVGEEYARTTGAMSDQALRLAAAQDRLNASIARSGPESRAAKTATLAYRQELAALAAEADAASSAVTRNAEAQARAAAAASDAAVKNQLASARTIGRTLTTYVTAPTILLGAVAVKMGFEYEDALRLIQTQAGATSGEVDRMTASVLGLVKSGESFGQTANDMAKGLFPIESEGIRDAKALQILKVAAAGAAVGQTDLASTANALTSVMRIYELDANQAAGAMATLNAAVGAGKLHMDDLNAALATKFLPTAKQLGITLPQALAALDVFTKAGIPAEVAANNLTTSFIKFESPTKAAAASLLQLGLSSTQLADDLQRGGLPAALSDLVSGYDRLEQSQGKVAANQAIFASFGGSRSGAPVLALVQQYQSYLKGLDQVQKQSNPATFWAQVARTMDLPSQKVKEDVAKITGELVNLGVTLAPIAADVVHAADEILGAFNKLPGPIKNDLGDVIALLAIGGPLILGLLGVRKVVLAVGTVFQELPAAAGPGIAATSAEVEAMETATAGAAGGVAALETAFRGLPLAAGPAIATTDAEIGALQEALAAATAETAGLGAAFEASAARAGLALTAVQGQLSALSLRGIAGGIGRAGLFAGGGLVAGQLADTYIPGQAGQDVGGVLKGAGIGAGLGSLIPGIGTAVGAGLGATVGLLLTLVHERPQVDALAQSLHRLGEQAAASANAIVQLHQQIANDQVGRDQADQELSAARAEERATRGTRQHAAAVDRLRAAQANLGAANQQLATDTAKLTKAEKEHQDAIQSAARATARAQAYTNEEIQSVIVLTRRAADRTQAYIGDMNHLADQAQSTNPKLAEVERQLARIAAGVHHIPSQKLVQIIIDTVYKTSNKPPAGIIGPSNVNPPPAKGKENERTGPRVAPFTTTIPIGLQVRFAQAQLDKNVAGERAALEAEKRFLEHELKLAKNKQQRLAALQALQAVQDQLEALTTKASTSKSGTAAARLEAEISGAETAEKNARTIKQEKAAYERERKAREQLLALYERSAHDSDLTAKQRADARRKAAAERKAIAALDDESQKQALDFALLRAENAVAAATLGSKAYDKAIAAEKKALEREIAYDAARANNAKLSLAARKKALEEELAAKKQLAKLDKQTASAAAANERQFLSSFAAITGSFGSNASPLGPHGGRMATHLYELVHDQRRQTAILQDIARNGRFGASGAAIDAALAAA